MKILLSLGAIALVSVLVASATMGADSLMPGGDSGKRMPRGTMVGESGKPRIFAKSIAPLVITGTGFRAGENVTVRLVDDLGTPKRKAKADGKGSFVVRFATRADKCNGLTATAVGDKGSRTAMQFSQLLCVAPGAGS
jgi:hypothetical protein